MNEDRIRARIEEFTRELEGLVRAAAIEAVSAALGQRGAGPRPAASTRSARPLAPAAPAARGKLAVARTKGAKRTPEQLARIDGAIVSFVRASPGEGVERMGKALAVPTRDLKARVLRLLAAGKIKKTGLKRATKYFPA